MTPIAIVVMLFTPFIVYAVTEIAQTLIPKLQGVGTLLAIPILTLLLNYLASLAGVELSYILQVIVGLGSLFVDRLLKAISDAPPPAIKP